jgi:hypothetical protein
MRSYGGHLHSITRSLFGRRLNRTMCDNPMQDFVLNYRLIHHKVTKNTK